MTILSIIKISSFHILLLCIFRFSTIYAQINSNQMQIPVPVRVVVDMNSSFGSMVNLCMDMAISDFYSTHLNYETRLQVINKDVKNTLDLNWTVVKHEQVAILGNQGSMQQETLAAVVGEAALVPIVSFTARSSALSYTPNSYFLRTTLDDAVEAEALAAICGRFGWSEAVIFYEDTRFGNQFLSHTIKAFQGVGIKLTYMAAIPLSAEDSHIKHQLNMVNAEPTRVFLVHMNPLLFALANDAGMMSQGYAWIVTDSISIFLNSINSETHVSMDGVVGIRPYVRASKNLKSFHQRWNRRSIATDSVMDLNIYGLWAYDTVTALAIAVENINPTDSSFGPRLVSELSITKFQGLAGDFELVDGKRKAGNMMSNKWSVFVLVCWLFMAFILMQSFTANLSAILTLDQLKFSFSEDYYVGYQEGSFMKRFLTENLHINETSLRGYSSVEGFHDAMSKGSKNGGIDAIFDDLPYMKLLMNRYKSQYKIVGPSYHTGGFGFAFPPGSPLTHHFSRAILNVTQGPTMSYLEGKNFGPGYSSQDPLSSVISQGTSSLTLREFAGLFFVTGSFVVFALFCSTTSIGRRLTHITQHFIPSCFSNRTPSPSEHSTELSSFVRDDDPAPDNLPPPPGEGSDAPGVGNEAADISDNESNTTQNARGIENQEPLAHN